MQQPIAYQGPIDLRRAQVALMRWTKQVGDCNCRHEGDIRRRVLNGGYDYQRQDVFHYWLNDDEQVMGFANLYFWDGMSDPQVVPELRYTEYDAHTCFQD